MCFVYPKKPFIWTPLTCIKGYIFRNNLVPNVTLITSNV